MLGPERDPIETARRFDERCVADIEAIELPVAGRLHSEIHHYLQRKRDKGLVTTLPKVQQTQQGGEFLINVGPTSDREQGGIVFNSGARLAIGITLRANQTGATLLSHRYRLDLPDAAGLKFIRIDLGQKENSNPLHVPRSHLHPGFENVHVPFPVMSPLDILDRIFEVIEPAFTG